MDVKQIFDENGKLVKKITTLPCDSDDPQVQLEQALRQQAILANGGRPMENSFNQPIPFPVTRKQNILIEDEDEEVDYDDPNPVRIIPRTKEQPHGSTILRYNKKKLGTEMLKTLSSRTRLSQAATSEPIGFTPSVVRRIFTLLLNLFQRHLK